MTEKNRTSKERGNYPTGGFCKLRENCETWRLCADACIYCYAELDFIPITGEINKNETKKDNI